jgi:hypothetical protein
MTFRIEVVDAAKADFRRLRTSIEPKCWIGSRRTGHTSRRSRAAAGSNAFAPGRTGRRGSGWEYIRVYYDVDETSRLVIVLGVIPESESAACLAGASTGRPKRDDQ